MLDFFMVACHANSVKGFLEIYEDMAEVLLVLEIFLAEVEDLLCGTPSCSSLSVSNDLLRFNLFSMIFSMTLLGD